MNAKCSCKVIKIIEAKSIEAEIVGDFLGTGEWTFESRMEKPRYRLNSRPEPTNHCSLSSFYS